MQKIKISAVFGTRPEAIKMCPLVLELKQRDEFKTRVILSGQHRELCRDAVDFFGVIPDADFNIMSHGQTLFDITEKIMQNARAAFENDRPDLVLVHGDTATAFASALTAFYLGIPVGHVEAGLRSGDILSPYPEEFYRRAIDALAFCHFCPTERARQNLIREGIGESRTFLTGNTVVDALKYTARESSDAPHPLLVVTLHRRESRGKAMANILSGILRAVEAFPELFVVFPVHPSREVEDAAKILADHTRIKLTPPLPLERFHSLLSSADLVLSDSGGVLEEAVSLRKPLLLARETTERPEGAESGCVFPVGRGENDVFDAILKYINSPPPLFEYENPFGDGEASAHIADAILSLHLEKLRKV